MKLPSLNSALNISEETAADKFLLSKKKSQAIKVGIYKLLSNPYINKNVENDVKKIFESHNHIMNNWIKGALGFFLFSRAAERFSHYQNNNKDKKEKIENYSEANKYLKIEETVKFIFEEYKIEKNYHFLNLIELHRVGTTSYILKFGKIYALKLIKFRYRDNQTIKELTEKYQEEHKKLGETYSPQIHVSNKNYIIMDFIKGQTLREYIKENFKVDNNDKEYQEKKLKKTHILMRSLCNALDYCTKNNIHHLDLSPDNIIVESINTVKAQIKLIDFGINYILTERVGSSSTFAYAETYIARELIESEEKVGSILADVYSLGIILLDMLSEREIRLKDIAYELEFVWNQYPDLAKIIEEMIDEDPLNRFLYYLDGSKDLNDIYIEIRRLIDSAIFIFENVHFKPKTQWQRIVESLPSKQKWKVIIDLFNTYISISNDEIAAKEVKRLLKWAITTNVVHTLILICLAIFIWDDFGLSKTVFNLFKFLGINNIKINPGGWKNNLPGRIVGWSFSITAMHYYLHIFSTISARGIDRITEFWIRLNSFCFSIPILWAVVYRPQDWPFCSAVGVWLVGINNYYCHKTGVSAMTKINEKFKLPQSHRTVEVLDYFGKWCPGIVWYGVFLFLGGVLFKLNLATDEWIYALTVTILGNFILMHYNTVSRRGERVKSVLMRMFHGYRRTIIKDKIFPKKQILIDNIYKNNLENLSS